MPGRILLVDANSASRIVQKFRLSACCYEVFTASAAETALDDGARVRPDLILIVQDGARAPNLPLIRAFTKAPATRNAPILVIGAPLSARERIALLEAGAEDHIERAADDDLLMARLRVLMRRRATADEVAQRDSTEREFALREAGVPFFKTQGLIGLISPEPRRAQAWLGALAPLVNARLVVMTMEAALAGRHRTVAPDVFLVGCGTGNRDQGLRLLTELRSRTETRHSAVVAMIDPADSDAAAARDRAVLALDIGAADVVLQGFNQIEIALRLQRHLAFKQKADQLRSSVRADLKLAVCDPLTGLYNRRYALPHLARIAAGARERQTPFATMLLDLDRFKRVNDTYGHPAGDAVLIAVAQRLRENLRSHDLLARIGGEEFLIAMPDTAERSAIEAAERLREIVRLTPVALPGGTQIVRVTCSIGVSVTHPASADAPEAQADVAGLIDRADGALYTSKSVGRDRVTVARSAA